jgi:hypothetical protein
MPCSSRPSSSTMAPGQIVVPAEPPALAREAALPVVLEVGDGRHRDSARPGTCPLRPARLEGELGIDGALGARETEVPEVRGGLRVDAEEFPVGDDAPAAVLLDEAKGSKVPRRRRNAELAHTSESIATSPRRRTFGPASGRLLRECRLCTYCPRADDKPVVRPRGRLPGHRRRTLARVPRHERLGDPRGWAKREGPRMPDPMREGGQRRTHALSDKPRQHLGTLRASRGGAAPETGRCNGRPEPRRGVTCPAQGLRCGGDDRGRGHLW